MNDYIIKNIVFLNGIYDVICTISILFLCDMEGFCYMAHIHPTMFHKCDPMTCRMMAYWIFTYGIIRLCIYHAHDNVLKYLIALTYFIEAFAFSYEDLVYQTTHTYKVIWVFLSSIIIGLLLLFIR